MLPLYDNDIIQQDIARRLVVHHETVTFLTFVINIFNCLSKHYLQSFFENLHSHIVTSFHQLICLIVPERIPSPKQSEVTKRKEQVVFRQLRTILLVFEDVFPEDTLCLETNLFSTKMSQIKC